jgi:hypothetical protein
LLVEHTTIAVSRTAQNQGRFTTGTAAHPAVRSWLHAVRSQQHARRGDSDAAPWDPHQVAVSPQVTGPNGGTVVTSLTPSFEATIGNTDGANVCLQSEVSYDPALPEDGNGEVWFGEGAESAPLSLASVTMHIP